MIFATGIIDGYYSSFLTTSPHGKEILLCYYFVYSYNGSFPQNYAFILHLVALHFVCIGTASHCVEHRRPCTVCGHPTMSNYRILYTMYYYIVGVGSSSDSLIVASLRSGYHCYSYYLSDYKLGVHVYCLWPLLFVCPKYTY